MSPNTNSFILPPSHNLIINLIPQTPINLTFNSSSVSEETRTKLQDQYLNEFSRKVEKYEANPIGNITFYGTKLSQFLTLDAKWKTAYLDSCAQMQQQQQQESNPFPKPQITTKEEALSGEKPITFDEKFMGVSPHSTRISLYNESFLPILVTVDGAFQSRSLIRDSMFNSFNLLRMRQFATSRKEPERVLVVGGHNSGKDAFSRYWLSKTRQKKDKEIEKEAKNADSMDTTPDGSPASQPSDLFYCDFGLSYSSMSVPGSMSVGSVTEPLTPLHQFSDPLVWYFGHASLSLNTLLFVKLVRVIGEHLLQNHNSSSFLVKMPPITSRVLRKVLLEVVQVMGINNIIVLGDEGLADFVESKCSEKCLVQSFVASQETAAKSKAKFLSLLNANIRHYFSGLHRSLYAYKIKLANKEFRVYRITESSVTSSKLPFARMMESSLREEEILKGLDLKGSFLAVSNGTKYDELALSTVKGFIFVDYVGQRDITVLAPVPKLGIPKALLPVLLVQGSIIFRESSNKSEQA